MDKKELLTKLYEPYKNCQMCPLSKLGRKNVVFGRGNPYSKVIFIGEAPGESEDIKGKPFIGRSGQLLTKVFKLVGINEDDIFITNIVKCRPPNNRQPTTDEISICSKILLEKEIEIVDPKIICTLGAIPTKFFLKDDNLKITKIQGQLFKTNLRTIMPLFHPSYILRNRSKANDWINALIMLKSIFFQ
jgi:uracil-DNA glycosylase family 4